MSKSNHNTLQKPSGLVTQIILSAFAVILGVLLLFVPQFNITTMCYILCGALIASGIAAIVIFFVSGAYQNMMDYHFSLGVVLFILGSCGLIRAEELILRFDLYIGFGALMLSVTMLQNMVQMCILHNKLWIVELVLTVLSLTGAVFIIADVRSALDAIENFSGIMILTAGTASFVCLLLSYIGLRQAEKNCAQVHQENRK